MKAKAIFSVTGFLNWKKALERFMKHEASQAHLEAVLKVASAAPVNGGGILDVSHKKQQLARQRLLIKQLHSIQFLVRQGLATWSQ